MKPINNWENVKATGSFETLPAGGYVCQIKSVNEVKNKKDGTRLEIMLDIAEGDYRGFFERDYRSQTREDKFWRGIANQNVPNEGSPKYEQQAGFFKRFINDIEESNPGYHWNWDEKTLVGRMIGVVFGEREKQSQKGTVYTTSIADSITTVDAIRKGAYKVPELRRLPNAPATSFGGFSPVADDGDLPF